MPKSKNPTKKEVEAWEKEAKSERKIQEEAKKLTAEEIRDKILLNPRAYQIKNRFDKDLVRHAFKNISSDEDIEVARKLAQNRFGSGKEKKKEQSIKHYGDTILEGMKLKTDIISGFMYLYNPKLNYYETELTEAIVTRKITDLLGDSYTVGTVKQVLEYLRTITGEDLRIYNHRNCVCLNNGIYDLDDGEFIKPNPELFVSFRLEVDFKPDIDMEPWDNYIESLTRPVDIQKLQESIGNIFANHYITKKMFFYRGVTNSGKTTFIIIIQRFLGKKNYSVLSLLDMERDSYQLADLYGKRANFGAETQYKYDYKNLEIIKKLVGGDEFTARRIYHDPFGFDNTAKMLISGNGIPYVSADRVDEAFYERWESIYFPNTFSKDDSFIEKMTTNEMKSRIFNWALEGYQRLRKNKWTFSNPTSVEDIIKLFEGEKSETNSFYAWLQERCFKTDRWERISTLFKDCMDWNAKMGLYDCPKNEAQFGIAMKNQRLIPIEDYRPVLADKDHCYSGISLRREPL